MVVSIKKATDQEKLAAFQNYDAWVFDLDGAPWSHYSNSCRVVRHGYFPRATFRPPGASAPGVIANSLISGIARCAGTIWKGSGLVPGAKEFIELLRSYQKKVFFVTNNATKSRVTNATKLTGLGIAATTAEVYTSSFAAAAYLKTTGFRKKAYVVGEKGLVDELSAAGITCVGGPEHVGKEVDWTEPEPQVEIDPEIGAVVVGLDRYINYYKLQYATTCLVNNSSCMFIACNTDSRGHFSSSQEWAGAGTMVAAIIGSSEREPMLLGKPASFILDHLCATHQISRDKCVVVGDRLDTDILWGNQNGVATCCVLTGVTSEAQLLSPENKVQPKLYVDSLGDFLTVKPLLPTSCTIM